MPVKVRKWVRAGKSPEIQRIKQAAVQDWATHTQRAIMARARKHSGDLRRSVKVRDTSTGKTNRKEVYSDNPNAHWENDGTGVYNTSNEGHHGLIYARSAKLMKWNSYKFPWSHFNPWFAESIRGKRGNKFWDRGVDMGKKRWINIKLKMEERIKRAMLKVSR